MKFLKFWFPVLVYSGIIFYGSSLESVETPQVIPHFDKVLHIGEYAVLGLLIARAVKSVNIDRANKSIVIVSVLLSALYGITDEIHQMYVPGRYADLSDLVADSIGGLLGAISYVFILNNKCNQLQKRN